MMRTIFLILILLTSTLALHAQFGAKKLLAGQTMYARDVFSIDLDNDGDIDVLSASTNDNKIAWYENLGNGIFSYQKVITNNAVEANCVFAIDLDNDGDNDVLSSSKTDNKIAWYENLGNGSFGPQQAITTNAIQATSVYSDDLDGDGFNDILYTSYFNQHVAWYRNNGNGTFSFAQLIVTSPTINRPQDIFTADIDGDLDMDILCVTSGDYKIFWCENQGAGVFGPINVIGTVFGATSINAADLDNDGDMDVLAAGETVDKIVWHENLGSGTFGPQQIITSIAASAKCVYTGDLDGDGKIDVLSASRSDKKVAWYKNLGSGVFSTENIITLNANGANAVTTGDIDNDGDLDVFTASFTDSKIAWHENNGSGVFNNEQVITESLSLYVNNSDDVNGDGLGEVISTRGRLYTNITSESYQIEELSYIYYDFPSVYSADLDGDNDLDIISNIDYSIIWNENTGNGNFSAYQTLVPNTGDRYIDINLADIDNDGDLDILAANKFNDTIYYFPNLGASVIGARQSLFQYSGPVRKLTTADIDGDNDLDLIISGNGSHATKWYENQGGFNFVFKQTFSGEAFNLNDYDNDGDLDIFTTRTAVSYTNSVVAKYENLGGGNYGPVQIISPVLYGATQIELSDIDVDGDLDILVATHADVGNTISLITWFSNLGNGTFGAMQRIDSIIGSWPSMSLVDINNDQDKELFYGNGNGYVIMLENYFSHNTQIRGRLFIDANQNSILDTNEVGLNQLSVLSTPQSDFTYTYGNGFYLMNFSDTAGSYQIFPQTLANWGITTDSLLYHIDVDSNFVMLDSLDFGFYPTNIVNELNAELIGSFPRCNTVINQWIDVGNIGSSIPKGIIHIQLDDSLSYAGSTVTPDSINGQNIYWHFDSLYYFAHEQINYRVLTPGVTSIGDTLKSLANIHITDALQNIIYTTTDTIDQILVCAYDPNDKKADPNGIDSIGYIHPNTPNIEYTVRFQNTGNVTAITVIIKDQLDSNLLWQTLTPLAASDPMQIDVDQNGLVSFKFLNIMLPDSGSDFMGSQGFVKYKIDLKPNLPVGTQIFNTARIYFDQNSAIVTNTKLHTLEICYFQPTASLSSFSQDTLCENSSPIILPAGFPTGGSYSGIGITGNTFDPSLSGSGTFYVYYTYTDTNSCTSIDSISIVVENCVSIDEFNTKNSFIISPNPTSKNVTITSTNNQNIHLYLYNSLGVLLEEIKVIQTKIINLQNYPSGVYFLKTISGKTSKIIKL